MKVWGKVMFRMLLLFYCILGTDLIDKYLFDYGLSGVRLAAVWAAVFISAYPLFGWRGANPGDVRAVGRSAGGCYSGWQSGWG